MLSVLLLICLASTLAKENFRTSSSSILAQCFSANLCSLSTGCCNGHGVCNSTSTGGVQCVCDTISLCTTNSNYTGSTCSIPPTGCPSDPSVSGVDIFWSTTAPLFHMPGADPDRGNYGNLLTREAPALFADGVSTPHIWSANVSTAVSDVLALVTALNLSMASNASGYGNMMGLGFLEVAQKDIVDFNYNYAVNVTFFNNTYPTVKWQNNTGLNVTFNGTTISIPKQFANNATGFIDLGPLYDWSHRVNLGSTVTPYLNISDALTHWTTGCAGVGHHMPHEFITALKFYAQYHYYAVRSFEEYFCGQNSTITVITNTCQLPYSGQSGWDWIYEQARRSTIRFSQAILQHSILQLTIEHLNADGTHMDGFYDPIFEFWFHRDDPNLPNGVGIEGAVGPSVRQHQEWNGNETRVSGTHHLISGLDFLVSLRNPNYDNTSTSLLSHASNCHPGIVLASIANDVMSLLHTPVQRYGTKVNSLYQADLALQLYRSNEIGLAGYKGHIAGLTNPTTTGVSDLAQDYNVYYRSQIETNSTRTYKNRIASVAIASIVPISDVTMVDRTSYWATITGAWNSINYHPDPTWISLPAYDFTNCYIDPTTGTCSNISQNAAAVVLGYMPDMNDLYGPPSWVQQENDAFTRSNGVTFPTPDPNGVVPSVSYDPSNPDYSERMTLLWRILPEVANPLFYQFDGLNTLAVKQAGSDVRYLANQLIDSIPTEIGFSDINFDYGICFRANLMYAPYSSDGCQRTDTNIYNGNMCYYSFPYLYE